MSHQNGHPPKFIVRLGRRKSDVEIMFDPYLARGHIKCNLAYVGGECVYLEEIPARLAPAGSSKDDPERMTYTKIQMGVVLISREWWPRMYFMNEREDWTEEQYFVAAAELISRRKQADQNFKSEN